MKQHIALALLGSMLTVPAVMAEELRVTASGTTILSQPG